MPPELEEGVLYVAVSLRLAMHRCCCGLWRRNFDDVISTSLEPNIRRRDRLPVALDREQAIALQNPLLD